MQPLLSYLMELRAALMIAFCPQTAAAGFGQATASSGQCAAVALVLNGLLGGSLVSANVSGVSHWFNRISFGGRQFDVDLTGDQFGLDPIQVREANRLYPDTRSRTPADVDADTKWRAQLLALRAKLPGIDRAQ